MEDLRQYDKYNSLFKKSRPVPHADSNGRQEGVIPPGLRNYKPGVYKVVDAATATSNMMARMNGEMELIKDGQDHPVAKDTADDMADPVAIPPKVIPTRGPEKSVPKEKDADWGPKPSEFDLTDDDGVVDVQGPVKGHIVPDHPVGNPYTDDKQYGHYMPTSMVTMEIRQEHQDGTYASLITVGLPVCKVVQNSVAVTLISPVTAGQYTFQPAAGSDILLNGAGLDNVHVFYPGTGFVLDDLHLSGMCFVKAN